MERETLVDLLDILGTLATVQVEIAQKIYAAEYATVTGDYQDVQKLKSEYRQTLLKLARGEMGTDRHIEQLAKIQQSISSLREKLSHNPHGE